MEFTHASITDFVYWLGFWMISTLPNSAIAMCVHAYARALVVSSLFPAVLRQQARKPWANSTVLEVVGGEKIAKEVSEIHKSGTEHRGPSLHVRHLF